MVKILDTGAAPAEKNMALDADLLASLDPNGDVILHLYDWERPSVTYGHFFKVEDHFNKTDLLDFAKRPTGGGALFHTTDYAFSLLIPRNHSGYHEAVMDNYAYVHSLVSRALGGDLLPEEPQRDGAMRFCYATPTKYDLMVGKRKAAGAAQRRTKDGYLHQGSISLGMPDENLLKKVLKSPDAIISAMRQNTYALSLTKEEVKQRLIQAMQWLEQQ